MDPWLIIRLPLCKLSKHTRVADPMQRVESEPNKTNEQPSERADEATDCLITGNSHTRPLL